MNVNSDKNANSTADPMDTAPRQEEVLREKLERSRDGTMSYDDMKLLKKELRRAGMLHEALEVSDMIEEMEEQLIEEMEEQKLRNARLLEKSIKNVYRKDGKPSCPVLKLNSTVKPSIEYHHLKGMGKQCVTYVDEKGDPATESKICIAEAAFWDSDELNKIVVPTKIQDPNYDLEQEIPSDFSPSVTLEYENEIKIQFHVYNMVLDAIRCLGYEGVLASQLEISMYGLAPDIILVNVESYKIVFVIEVKAPDKVPKDDEEGKTEFKVCHNGKTGYQIWIYLQALKSLGVPCPIGAICTFNELRLVWLPPSVIDEKKPPFRTALDKLMKGTATPHEVKPAEKSPVSPLFKRTKASDETNKYDKKQLQKLFDEECVLNDDGVYVFAKPKLCGGQVVHTIDIFPQLLLGLQAAIDANSGENNTSDSVLTVEPGDELGSRCYMYVSPDNMTRAFTPNDMAVKKGMPHKNVSNFFLPSIIGRGKDADVHLALSRAGNAGAIKWYHRERSKKATEKERAEELKEILVKIATKCTEEETHWHRLYPKYDVRTVTTNGAASLLMPLGRSLDMKQYQEYLPNIEAELRRFAEQGLVYGEPRLQHSFLDENGHLFLADLGSLKPIEDDTERQKLLDEHIAALHKRHNDRLKANSENNTPSGMKRKRTEGNSLGEKKPRARTGV